MTAAAVEINAENVFKHIMHVSNKWMQLGPYLNISESKMDEIKKSNNSDDDCFVAVINEWQKGSPSWRWLIFALDWIDETTTADGLKRFAEPVKGKVYSYLHLKLDVDLYLTSGSLSNVTFVVHLNLML